ncbi:recombinase family protein [Nocardioides houyundeii]|uniref:recombinase family protein n=1 Tax=Nocardioides houyundeii TaxID=2045452 RepID=UPI0013155985|nr:recombinase family protein [Nocardioides houyundeii]
MRVYGYARLSRASEDSTSIEKQRDIITRTAEARGWDLIGIAADESVSATKARLNRPGLTEAREAVLSSRADAILCWRLDRIARNVVDMSLLLDEGVGIVSATEPYDTTSPMGLAIVQITQVFAGLEAATTGERAKATKAYLRGLRRWGGGPRPYGYRPGPAPDGVGKVLRVDEAEADVIRRIFADLLDGVPVNRLARNLTTEGIPTATGRDWKPASVLNIARALHVSGYLTESVRDQKGHPTRQRRPVHDEGGAPVRAWEPLVDDETAEAVRALVTPQALDEARSSATREGLTAPRPLLHGLAFCPCGEALIRRSRRGRAFYGCRGISEGSHVLVDAAEVDAEAERLFLTAFSGVEIVERVVEVSVSEALAEVETALAVATAEIAHTATGDLPALFERISELTAERERLGASEDRVTTRRTRTPYGAAWDGWAVGERRKHMAALGVRVSVLPARRRGAWDPSRVRLSSEVDYLVGQTEDLSDLLE